MFLLIFLQKCCTVQKNQSFFAVLSQKNQSFGRPVVGSCLKTGKIVFFWFFLDSTALLKDWFFWDSTVFFVNFLTNVLYCPKKTNHFCKSAVLSQKTNLLEGL